MMMKTKKKLFQTVKRGRGRILNRNQEALRQKYLTFIFNEIHVLEKKIQLIFTDRGQRE